VINFEASQVKAVYDLSWLPVTLPQFGLKTGVVMTLSEMIDELISDFERTARDEVKYPWQESVERALATKRPKELAFAETTVYRRREALLYNQAASHERQALEDAIDQLQNVRELFLSV